MTTARKLYRSVDYQTIHNDLDFKITSAWSVFLIYSLEMTCKTGQMSVRQCSVDIFKTLS